MGDKSQIQWTDATWNPITGCTKISPGCKNCYAEKVAARMQAMGQPNYRNGFSLTLHPHMLDVPRRWKRPRRIFVNSMSDMFHRDVPEDFIFRILDVVRDCPQHTFQVLTKRSERMREVMTNYGTVLPNLWLGVSVETPGQADRIDHLRATPAAIRFVSFEPWLSRPIDKDIRIFSIDLENVDWAIIGGESGINARPLWEGHVYLLIAVSRKSGTAVFVKQLGSVWAKQQRARHHKGGDPSEWPANLQIQEFPNA